MVIIKFNRYATISSRKQGVIFISNIESNFTIIILTTKISITNLDVKVYTCGFSSISENDRLVFFTNNRHSVLSRPESSRRNQCQHKRCHRYQRNNLFRDLIQINSLPINFLRNAAPPHWGAGAFLLRPAWSGHLLFPRRYAPRVFLPGKTRQPFRPLDGTRRPSFGPVRPRPRQRLRPGLVESSRLGDMLWLYSPFR